MREIAFFRCPRSFQGGEGYFLAHFSKAFVCTSKKSFRAQVLEMCYLQFYIGAAIKRASELIIILAYQIFTRACFQSRNQTRQHKKAERQGPICPRFQCRKKATLYPVFSHQITEAHSSLLRFL